MMSADQMYLTALAARWFFTGLAAGTAIGMLFSALMRWLTESRG